MFGNESDEFGKVDSSAEVLVNWEEIKKRDKIEKEDVSEYLGDAFDEAQELIDKARKRKGY